MNDNNFRFFLILFLMVLPIISVYLYTGYNIQSKEWENQRMSKESEQKQKEFKEYIKRENIKFNNDSDFFKAYLEFSTKK